MGPIRKTPLGIAFTKAALFSAFAFGWGAMLLHFADDTPDGNSPADAYQVHGIAIALMAVGFVGFVYWVLKQRAPSLRDRNEADLSADAAEPGFDADAALQRYLSTRTEGADPAPPTPRQDMVRPQPGFGRRGAPPEVDNPGE